jgi:hypothetical protein
MLVVGESQSALGKAESRNAETLKSDYWTTGRRDYKTTGREGGRQRAEVSGQRPEVSDQRSESRKQNEIAATEKGRVNRSAVLKLVLVVVLLGLAPVLYWKLSPSGEARDDQAYFYDLKEQKLFVASRSLIPPAPGIKGSEPTGVRAVVISTNGNPKDAASRRIAYLEKYSPELKQVLEGVRAGKVTDVPSHEARQGQIYVKRLTDSQWYPINTPEGERVMSEWSVPGPGGVTPVVCSP